MSKVTASTSVQQVREEEFSRFVDIALQNIVEVINGNLDFQTNINCKLMTLVFDAANVERSFSHNLGRIPVGYIVTKTGTTGARPFDTTTAFNANTIYLQATSAGNCSIILF